MLCRSLMVWTADIAVGMKHIEKSDAETCDITSFRDATDFALTCFDHIDIV